MSVCVAAASGGLWVCRLCVKRFCSSAAVRLRGGAIEVDVCVCVCMFVDLRLSLYLISVSVCLSMYLSAYMQAADTGVWADVCV